MKRIFPVILAILLVFALIPIAHASIMVEIDGVQDAHITDINFTGPSALTRTGRKLTLPVVDASMIAAGAANGGATSMTSLDLAVPVGYSYVRKAIADDSAFTAGTMADGKKGQLLTIHITEQYGSEVFTLTPTTMTGFTSIKFDAIGEIATFLYVDDTTGWILFGDTNATIYYL